MTEPTTQIDVNTANTDELDAVLGLHDHEHQIVHYRGERGGFTDLRQLDEMLRLSEKDDGSTDPLTVGKS